MGYASVTPCESPSRVSQNSSATAPKLHVVTLPGTGCIAGNPFLLLILCSSSACHLLSSSASHLLPQFCCAMTDDIKFENCVNELTAAAKTLTADWRRDNLTAPFSSGSSSPYSIFSPDAPENVRRSQRSILASVSKMQVMMAQPVDFLQRLTFYVRPFASDLQSCTLLPSL